MECTVERVFSILAALVAGIMTGIILQDCIRAGMTSYQVSPVNIHGESPEIVAHLPSSWLPGYSQNDHVSEEEVVPPRERTGQDANNPPVYVSQERLDNLIEPRDETRSRDDNRPRDDE